jgi:ribosomal protein L11 methylase PrmA
MSLDSLEHTKTVLRVFKRVSDGAHGNTRGIHGSLTPCSLHKVLSAIDVYGRNIMDLGAGTGVVLAAALTNGASKVHGIELPENQANQYIFNAAMRQISRNFIEIPSLSRRTLLEFNDIEKVFWLHLAPYFVHITA